jgi:aspartate aminotransferase-like enzyme
MFMDDMIQEKLPRNNSGPDESSLADLCHKLAGELNIKDKRKNLLLLPGSASYALELAMSTAVKKGKEILILDLGRGTDRLIRLATWLRIPYTILVCDPESSNLGLRVETQLRMKSRICAVAGSFTEVLPTGLITEDLIRITNRRNISFVVDFTTGKPNSAVHQIPYPAYIISRVLENPDTGIFHTYILSDKNRLRRIKRTAQKLIYSCLEN